MGAFPLADLIVSPRPRQRSRPTSRPTPRPRTARSSSARTWPRAWSRRTFDALAGGLLGQYYVGAVGGPVDLQDALAVDQAAGPAELGPELWALLRDFISCLAVLRGHLQRARHAADPVHALDAGRAVVHDDLHVRRDAQVHDAGDVARGRRRGHGRD